LVCLQNKSVELILVVGHYFNRCLQMSMTFHRKFKIYPRFHRIHHHFTFNILHNCYKTGSKIFNIHFSVQGAGPLHVRALRFHDRTNPEHAIAPRIRRTVILTAIAQDIALQTFDPEREAKKFQIGLVKHSESLDFRHFVLRHRLLRSYLH